MTCVVIFFSLIFHCFRGQLLLLTNKIQLFFLRLICMWVCWGIDSLEILLTWRLHPEIRPKEILNYSWYLRISSLIYYKMTLVLSLVFSWYFLMTAPENLIYCKPRKKCMKSVCGNTVKSWWVKASKQQGLAK